MANPPPVRPWSRLASLRPAPPKPTPQNQPSQPSEPSAAQFVTAPRFLGAAGRTSAPSSPSKNVPAPSASLPNSPSPKASQAPNTSTIDKNANANATKSPQRTTPPVQTTMQSQNPKLNTPPPSPLVLPPSHLKVNTEVEPKVAAEPEPKAVLAQKESGENKKQGIGQHENQTKGKGIHKRLSNSEDSGLRVITISGENRGAYMEIIQSSKKPNNLHKKGNSKIKAYDYESENSGSGDGNANRKNKKYSPPMSAYINSNVQCVNNSLLYETSCTSSDPGVQLILSRKPSGEGFHQRERVDGKNN